MSVTVRRRNTVAPSYISVFISLLYYVFNWQSIGSLSAFFIYIKKLLFLKVLVMTNINLCSDCVH